MKPNFQTNILSRIEILSKRPGMILGNDTSLEACEKFINGYFSALVDIEVFSNVNTWAYWIHLKYKMFPPKWNWAGVLKSKYGNEKKIFMELPTLMNEFLSAIVDNGESAIIQEFNKVGSKKST